MMKRIIAVLSFISLVACSHVEEDHNGSLDQSEQNPEQQKENNTSGSEQPSSEETVLDIPVFSPDTEAIIEGVSLTSEQELLQLSANRFAFHLLLQMYEDHSFVFSPFSLQIALSMALNGAEGETAEEMFRVLGYDSTDFILLNTYAKSLLEQLPVVDASARVRMADAIIVNEDYHLLPDFQTLMSTYYYAPIVNLPFHDEVAVKDAINEWCTNSTDGAISKLLDRVSPAAIMYLLNALYFNAEWYRPFDEEFQILHNQPFYLGNGEVLVDYLVSGEDLMYAENDSFQLVTRPLGIKGSYELAILLPGESSSIASVLETIQETGWKDICMMQKPTFLQLEFPKFQIESSFELVDVLRRMGMKRAFGEGAQFTKMVSEGVPFITSVLQKSIISIDESGVEAATATLIEMADTDSGEDETEPVLFHANHPFIYMIIEKTSGTILLAGVYDGK